MRRKVSATLIAPAFLSASIGARETLAAGDARAAVPAGTCSVKTFGATNDKKRKRSRP